MNPIIGKIVVYVLTEENAIQVNRRRTSHERITEQFAQSTWRTGAQAHVGNAVSAGMSFPMIITKFDVANLFASGQVFLDGNDCLWVQNIEEGWRLGTYHCPKREGVADLSVSAIFRGEDRSRSFEKGRKYSLEVAAWFEKPGGFEVHEHGDFNKFRSYESIFAFLKDWDCVRVLVECKE